jgi:hypothetical protein
VDTKTIERLANGARAELLKETAATLRRVLAQGSAERLSSPQVVQAIDAEIARTGEQALIERVAYTWFNRLCALRFMDMRGYTPVGIVSPKEGATTIAILADAQQGIFSVGLNINDNAKGQIANLLSGIAASNNPLNDAYKELLRAACNHYAYSMSYLFGGQDGLADAINLLMPDDLISQDSIVRRICDGMGKEACESVEVLGWLYQFYIAERKDEVFAGFKKNKKAGAAELAPATQLFTPNWIVRYMVENSLGRLWLLNKPNSSLRQKMDYYIESDPSHHSGLDPESPKTTLPKQINCLDPACGSGHILVYMFDLLFEMYEESGYMPEDIPELILQNNLSGYEIDPRAAEIASFALEMKALERDPQFLAKAIDANIIVLEKIEFDADELAQLSLLQGRPELLAALAHMDEVGSLYKPCQSDMLIIQSCQEALESENNLFSDKLKAKLAAAIRICEALHKRFEIVVANPPYMGSGNMNVWLSGWLKEKYPDEKSDLCTCFIERCLSFNIKGSFVSLVTSNTWLFSTSFSLLRNMLLNQTTIVTLAHTRGKNNHSDVFDANVIFTLENLVPSKECLGSYFTLNQAGVEAKRIALLEAIKNPNCGWFYRRSPKDFATIPCTPIAYWVSAVIAESFTDNRSMVEFLNPKQGTSTGNDNKFIRYWFEIDRTLFSTVCQSLNSALNSEKRYYPINKGGDYRKWFGNNEKIIKMGQNDYEELLKIGNHLPSRALYFKTGITWSKITSYKISVRYDPEGFVFSSVGLKGFPTNENLSSTLSFLNSKVCDYYLTFMSPTLSIVSGDIEKLPFNKPKDALAQKIDKLCSKNIEHGKTDWDSFETSWDFQRHPLLGSAERAFFENAGGE